jgi:N-acetylmuramoyl-L-alanine amidase
VSTLGDYLEADGFDVDDAAPYGRESTWRGVEFLMVHHTVSDCDGSESSIANYCRTETDYPPICHIVLGHSGKVWMTSKQRSGQAEPGRASHAGSGSGYGIPDDTMNERCLGIEVQCDGSHKLATHAEQYDWLLELLASLCWRYNVPTSKIIGHKEWSTTGKVDPRDDMATIRSQVAALMEGDTMWSDYSGKPSGTFRVTNGQDYEPVDFETADPPSAGLEFHLIYANCELEWSTAADGLGVIRLKYVRENGDATAYQDYTCAQGASIGSPDTFLLTATHWEAGESGLGGRWHIRAEGDLAAITLGTRYAKIATVG